LKKILFYLGAFVTLNIVTGLIGFGLFYNKFLPKIPKASYPPAETVTEARMQDLNYLEQLSDVDKSFSDEERLEFEDYLEDMASRVSDLSDAEFAISVMKAVAITDNGHTNVRLANLADDYGSLPVRFYWFADGLHIVRAHSDYKELIGARVLTYDRREPANIAKVLESYSGGNAAHARYMSTYLFASPELMHAAELAEAPHQVDLTLKLLSGEPRDITLAEASTLTETMPHRDHPLAKSSKYEIESEADWVFLDGRHETNAHFGRHPEEIFWSEDLPGGGLYIRIRIIKDDHMKLSAWLKTLRKEHLKDPAEYLVLDLRANPGGDYMKSRNFAGQIDDLIVDGGQIYTLTDEGTFSAAIVTAAYAAHAAKDQHRFVGSDMGDGAQFWAEGGRVFKLPNSGIPISVSTAFHDWENGCLDWSTCYWLNIVLGVGAGPLDIDLYAPLRFEDYIEGRDTTLQAVLTAEGVSE
jgi:hypothetical protein